MSFYQIRRDFIKIGLLAALIAVSLMNTIHADEVVMKNGSRLIGTVISMESGKLVFKTSMPEISPSIGSTLTVLPRKKPLKFR